MGLRIEHLKDLKPDPANARKHGPRNVGLIVDALHEVGAARSIVIDEQNVVLAGNATVEAAAEAGITKVQVVDADGQTVIAVRRHGLTPQQKARLALYDNRTAELAEGWNVDVLAALQADGVTLDKMWTEEELAELLSDGQKVGLTEPDVVPEERATDIVRGDLFTLGQHRLLCGDSTKAEDVAMVMGGEKAQAVVTDSPYGIGRAGITNDDEGGLKILFNRVLSVLPISDGIVINFQSPRLFPAWLDALREAGHVFERALWFYDETDVTFPWRGWLMTSQMALVSSIGSPIWPSKVPFHHDCYLVKTAGKQDDSGGHTAAKPIDVVVDLISHTIGHVYEPFSGSGTTLIACEQLKRRCYAIEIEPRYVQVAIDRWEQFTGQKALKVGAA